jgi:hypothetical protein
MRFSILVAAAASLVTPFAAWAYDDPKALVTAIYEPYMHGGQHADVGQFYSTHLKQLFADHAEKQAAEIDTKAAVPLTVQPVVDFNPFIDAQHALLLDIVVGEPVVVGDKALVTVGFHNFDQPTLLSLSLVREGDGWKVDDVTSMGGEQNWMLSWLLQFDPWSM